MDAVIALIKLSEGCKDGDARRPGLQPYLCPAGIPTIGWGSTAYADGRRVTMADPGVDEAEAEELLLLDVKRAESAVARLIKVPLLPGAKSALIDFVYNLGAGRLQSSTLRSMVNRGAPEPWRELRKWVFAGGRKLPGLVVRREREIALWLSDVGGIT